MTGKQIMKRAGILCAGLLSCALLTSCKQSKNNANNLLYSHSSQATPRQINNFSLKSNLPHYELATISGIASPLSANNATHNKLYRVLHYDFHNQEHFKHLIVSDFQVDYHQQKRVAFESDDLTNESKPWVYHAIVPNLYPHLTKHTITFIEGNDNVTYKLYNLRNMRPYPKHKKWHGVILTLIPTKYRLDKGQEKQISHKQGEHYLTHLTETERLQEAKHMHASKASKALP